MTLWSIGSYHSDSYHSDIVCAPESAPSLFFKPQVLAFSQLNDLNCSRTTQPHRPGDVIFIILKRFPSIPFQPKTLTYLDKLFNQDLLYSCQKQSESWYVIQLQC